MRPCGEFEISGEIDGEITLSDSILPYTEEQDPIFRWSVTMVHPASRSSRRLLARSKRALGVPVWPGRFFGVGLLLLTCMGNAHAVAPKTLMVLVDWWQNLPMDTVVDLKVSQPRLEIHYRGGNPPDLVATDAFVTERFAKWFALDGFVADDYTQGRIRFNASYKRGWILQNSSLQLAPANSGTEILNHRSSTPSGELPGQIDRCIDSLKSDTVWLRWGTPSIAPGPQPSASDMRCFDHNPFFPARGRVSVFSPWSRSGAWALIHGTRQQLRPHGPNGWLSADIWTIPGDSGSLDVTFRFDRPDGVVRILDSAGKPYHPDSNSGSDFIQPTMGTSAGFHASALPKPVVFAWINPWKNRLAELHLGGDERIQGVWHSGGWYSASIWSRPSQAGLVSVDGDSSSTPVNVPAATSGTPDTIWLTQKPSALVQARLSGTIYDYRMGLLPFKDSSIYDPFSHRISTGPINGLVKNRLGSAGQPVWSGKPTCENQLDTSKPCENALNAPERWFQSKPGTNLPLPFSLTLPAAGDETFSFSDSLFFPLDTQLNLPGTTQYNPFFDQYLGQNMENHNFGFCFDLHGMAQPVSGGTLTIRGDDDTWVFLDSQLVVDMGGQHTADSRTVSMDLLARPLPALVSLDIFHCERYVNESNFGLVVNFPIYPAGMVLTSQATSEIRPTSPPRSRLSMAPRPNALSITAPAGQPWNLELRGLDGRLQRAVSGTGAAQVPWSNSGLCVAVLRNGTETVTARFVGTR